MPIWVIKGIIVAVVIGLLTWGLLAYRQSLIDMGYDNCKTEFAQAKQEADEKTRKEQTVIKKKSQEVEDEIYKSPDGDIPDVIRNQLKRMRER